MISLATNAAIPATGPLAALGPIGGIAEMAMLAFGGNFNAQMTRYNQNLKQMTPQQVSAQTTRSQGIRSVTSRSPTGSRFQQGLLSTGRNDVSFLSGLGKVFGGVSTIGGIFHDVASVIHPATTAAGKAATTAIDAVKPAVAAAGKAIRAHPIMAAAGAATAVGAAGAAAAMGRTPAQHVKAVKQALGLHHRRMHVTNTKALHRALRRVKGFERVARHVMTITHHKPVKVHFKFRKRKAA